MDLIGTFRRGDKKGDFRFESGRNHVQIRTGEGFGKGQGQRGRSGWDGLVAPPENLDEKFSEDAMGGWKKEGGGKPNE